MDASFSFYFSSTQRIHDLRLTGKTKSFKVSTTIIKCINNPDHMRSGELQNREPWRPEKLGQVSEE